MPRKYHESRSQNEVIYDEQHSGDGQHSREELMAYKKALSEDCANCQDFERVLNKKNGGCVTCEIFKVLSNVSKELENS